MSCPQEVGFRGCKVHTLRMIFPFDELVWCTRTLPYRNTAQSRNTGVLISGSETKDSADCCYSNFNLDLSNLWNGVYDWPWTGPLQMQKLAAIIMTHQVLLDRHNLTIPVSWTLLLPKARWPKIQNAGELVIEQITCCLGRLGLADLIASRKKH